MPDPDWSGKAVKQHSQVGKRRGYNFEALFCHYFLFYGLLHLFMEVCIALLLGAIVLIGMKYEL